MDENEQQDDQDWGQWLAGAPDAAPAANLDLLDFDLNNPGEGNNENVDHLMDMDLNDFPMQEPDNILNDNAESGATSIPSLLHLYQ
jgi:hypothetical protein